MEDGPVDRSQVCKPNTNEIIFEDLMTEKGIDDVEAKILTPEDSQPNAEAAKARAEYMAKLKVRLDVPKKVTPEELETMRTDNPHNKGREASPAETVILPKKVCAEDLSPEEITLLENDLLRANEIVATISPLGCPPELLAKVRAALVIEACKRRL